jgi:hypothetical protein
MHAFLMIISEGLSYFVGKRWLGLAVTMILLLLVWLLLLLTR